ncbi:hypothetical protein E2C01_054773 [Portunus trituberculatus]|uniref:Uncharacterized protein n=1 Tax=Portunus trituberculatus TaxID=210409 RepID=A0A5B7GUU8_PORTR|nr:hypothetical protein [Portunus trituberculatus]
MTRSRWGAARLATLLLLAMRRIGEPYVPRYMLELYAEQSLSRQTPLPGADLVRSFTAVNTGAITLAYDTRNAAHGAWYETRNTITYKLSAFLLC